MTSERICNAFWPCSEYYVSTLGISCLTGTRMTRLSVWCVDKGAGQPPGRMRVQLRMICAERFSGNLWDADCIPADAFNRIGQSVH